MKKSGLKIMMIFALMGVASCATKQEVVEAPPVELNSVNNDIVTEDTEHSSMQTAALESEKVKSPVKKNKSKAKKKKKKRKA